MFSTCSLNDKHAINWKRQYAGGVHKRHLDYWQFVCIPVCRKELSVNASGLIPKVLIKRQTNHGFPIYLFISPNCFSVLHLLSHFLLWSFLDDETYDQQGTADERVFPHSHMIMTKSDCEKKCRLKSWHDILVLFCNSQSMQKILRVCLAWKRTLQIRQK